MIYVLVLRQHGIKILQSESSTKLQKAILPTAWIITNFLINRIKTMGAYMRHLFFSLLKT